MKILDIIGCGAVSCVGFSAPATCAAIRASIAGFKTTGLRDKVKGPTIWAEVPLQPSPLEAKPYGRLVAMGAMALKECVNTTGIDIRECPVFLGVREPFRVDQRSDWRSHSLLEKILEYSGVAMHSDFQVFPEGNASFFVALDQARQLLALNRSKVCLVGGVDSFLNYADLRRFGDSYRLISDEVNQGFVPGEGAAFIAVTRADGTRSVPKIKGIGLAREDRDRTVLTDAAAEGRGLEIALNAALSDARLPESIVEFRVSDLNGETYRGRESMLAICRVYRTNRSHFPQIYPASCIGETGAAAGAFLVVVAAAALIKGYAPGRVAMCEASSDAGLRGACIVSAL